jgi:ferredoxin
VFVKSFACDGHGVCLAVAPGVFKMGSDGKSYVAVTDIADSMHDSIRAAALRCPNRAVLVIE